MAVRHIQTRFELGRELVAKQTEFGEMLPAALGGAIWLYFLLFQGVWAAFETIYLLLIAVPLASWTLSMRLWMGSGALVYSTWPWRRTVDLTAIESVTWKRTGGGLSRGAIYVRDRNGGRVPIYVGRLSHWCEWAPRLLEAAARSHAQVDETSRRLLEGDGSRAEAKRGR